jgi:hypothetical protein
MRAGARLGHAVPPQQCGSEVDRRLFIGGQSFGPCADLDRFESGRIRPRTNGSCITHSNWRRPVVLQR